MFTNKFVHSLFFIDFCNKKSQFVSLQHNVLLRDQYQCRICKKPLKMDSSKLSIFVFKGTSRFPNLNKENFISLCHFHLQEFKETENLFSKYK